MTNFQNHIKLDDQLFRRSYSKTVATLINYFGLAQVELAEDVVQETLLNAFEQWSIHGVPQNPDGWIMDVAKKKTINILKRDQLFKSKVIPSLNHEYSQTNREYSDNTLKMIFACCHPKLPSESQIALALKTLCGLSVPEIARALLTTQSNINKRLYRAKEKFRTEQILFVLPAEESGNKEVKNVCKTLYLLFNEGYYAPEHKELIRMDLCFEAIRLLQEVNSLFPDSSEVNGLLAMMYFSVARFESRLDNSETLVCLQDQDRNLWDKQFINLGMNYLNKTTINDQPNVYQLLAGIAAEHCIASSFDSTNWQSIYDQYLILEAIDSSELVQVNKYISLFFLGNKQEAIEGILKVKNTSNSTYNLTLGALYSNLKDIENARKFLLLAMKHSNASGEKLIIQRELEALTST